ncbi:MAG TPA: hypothetical protein VGE07_20280 [Herpetosiphonaceae bacterium]
MKAFVFLCLLLVALAGAPTATQAAPTVTYEVGPGRQYARLSQVAPLVSPGDLVLVYGNGATPYEEAQKILFDRPGTAANPITIRGVRVNGRRPILSSPASITVEFGANHYVFEGFEATGTTGNHRVLYHHADNIKIRDTLIRDCPGNGLLGADEDSGSLLLEYVEVTNCGSGTFEHAIYMATGLPGAVFRMQFCYLHDNKGGNGVKSRANRNEIYYNWIEGSFYHELELIGPDDGTGGTPESPREDSDVVGNVLIKRQDFPVIARFGGDGTGQTWGRYRFVNNTVILQAANATVIRAFEGIESLELHNNVFANAAGGGVNLVRTVEAEWRNGEAIGGSRNWIPTGSTIPAGLTQTVQGTNPSFTNLAGNDLRPQAGSPLVNAGSDAPATLPAHPFPTPLFPAGYQPQRTQVAPGAALVRPRVGITDIGAFEIGVPPTLSLRRFLPAVLR